MYGSQSGSRLFILREPFSVYRSFGSRAPVFSYSLGLAHLLGKVKMKYQNKNAQNCPANMSIIRELCDIRDGRHIACDIISKAEVCMLA